MSLSITLGAAALFANVTDCGGLQRVSNVGVQQLKNCLHIDSPRTTLKSTCYTEVISKRALVCVRKPTQRWLFQHHSALLFAKEPSECKPHLGCCQNPSSGLLRMYPGSLALRLQLLLCMGCWSSNCCLLDVLSVALPPLLF